MHSPTSTERTRIKQEKGQWKSRMGFILSASGAAVGLGNIQRFPSLTAEFGGAAFVLVYLLSVLCIAFPLILVEFAIGRHSQKNPVDAIKKVTRHPFWQTAGYLGIATAFFIFTYYLVASAWAFGFAFESLMNRQTELADFAKDPWKVFPLILFFQAMVVFVVCKGVKQGLEKANKVVMPLLFILLIALVIRSLSLPGSFAGVLYYLVPDISKITPQVVLYALGQSFFSLCIGEAVLLTYGSYTSKKENLVSSALYIALFDTVVAILAGLLIFPAIFAFQETPSQGIGLVYHVMPKVFLQMPFGGFFGFLFFLILSFAAFTTCIALLEAPVNFFIQKFGWKRKQATFFLATIALLFAIPSALSKGMSETLSNFTLPFLKERGIFDLMDFLFGGLAMVIGGWLLSIIAGWVWGTKKCALELAEGAHPYPLFFKIWSFLVRFVAPTAIFLIFLSLFY
jgi:NSS family neurotransmitter:Na+ symporter